MSGFWPLVSTVTWSKPVDIRARGHWSTPDLGPGERARSRDRPHPIVDDMPANVRLLEAVLAPRGYTVETAGSGAQAL